MPSRSMAIPATPRILVLIDGVKVDFIDLANLKKNKLSTGRHQDLADLENLK
jgi:hypothetical protein